MFWYRVMAKGYTQVLVVGLKQYLLVVMMLFKIPLTI